MPNWVRSSSCPVRSVILRCRLCPPRVTNICWLLMRPSRRERRRKEENKGKGKKRGETEKVQRQTRPASIARPKTPTGKYLHTLHTLSRTQKRRGGVSTYTAKNKKENQDRKRGGPGTSHGLSEVSLISGPGLPLLFLAPIILGRPGDYHVNAPHHLAPEQEAARPRWALARKKNVPSLSRLGEIQCSALMPGSGKAKQRRAVSVLPFSPQDQEL
ncbi:hypothetical protein VTG60DRAFT_7049 [Thermothelomyces hinnuleus]